MLFLLSVVAWYIPGLWGGEISHEDSECLRRALAADAVVCKSWCLPGTAWSEAIDGADAFVDRIFDELRRLDDSRRSEIVLVGHSLGARVVSKAVVRLAEVGLMVGNVVLLGAAIPSDIGLIKPMLLGCAGKPIVVRNEGDAVLKYIYPLVVGDGIPAMGCHCVIDVGNDMIEYAMPEDFAWHYNLLFPSHNSSVYIRYLEKAVRGDNVWDKGRAGQLEYRKSLAAWTDVAVRAVNTVTKYFNDFHMEVRR